MGGVGRGVQGGLRAGAPQDPAAEMWAVTGLSSEHVPAGRAAPGVNVWNWNQAQIRSPGNG